VQEALQKAHAIMDRLGLDDGERNFVRAHYQRSFLDLADKYVSAYEEGVLMRPIVVPATLAWSMILAEGWAVDEDRRG
jgi:hypothetical protein